MHPITVAYGADVVGHQVILLQLVVQAGDAGDQVHQLAVQYNTKKNSLPEPHSPYQLLLISFADVTSLSEKSSPQLDTNNAKDEEKEEAEEQHIAQHGQGVQQQHHQDPHA